MSMSPTASATITARHRGLDFDAVLKPLTSYENKTPLPNWDAVDPMSVLQIIASGGHTMRPHWGYARIPGAERPQWTMFFFRYGCGQGLGLDGTGYTVTYGAKTPITGHFAICIHEKVDALGANHERGWHPGHCKHCGIDMTVDSGD